jgi:hypothetical protein
MESSILSFQWSFIALLAVFWVNLQFEGIFNFIL